MKGIELVDVYTNWVFKIKVYVCIYFGLLNNIGYWNLSNP